MTATEAKPFVKWAGGKRQLMPEIRARAPEKFGMLYEPFVGGAAVTFALRPRRAVIGDANEHLATAYIGVRNDVEDVIKSLKRMPYESDYYYETRSKMPDLESADPDEVAAWVIYVNKAGFNGLWRVNRKGEFNVPFGRYTNPTICDADNLRACSKALRTVNIRIGDFEKTVRSAERGDFVYFDPPYVPASATADFTAYTAGGFGYPDQVRLRDCAAKLKRRGVHVMLSNAEHPIVRKLYRGGEFKIERVRARRAINSDADGRGTVGEVIIT